MAEHRNNRKTNMHPDDEARLEWQDEKDRDMILCPWCDANTNGYDYCPECRRKVRPDSKEPAARDCFERMMDRPARRIARGFRALAQEVAERAEREPHRGEYPNE